MGKKESSADWKELYDCIISDPDYSESVQRRCDQMSDFLRFLDEKEQKKAIKTLREFLDTLYKEHQNFHYPAQPLLQAQIRDMQIVNYVISSIKFADLRLSIAYDTTCRERIMAASSVKEADEIMIELIEDSFRLFYEVQKNGTEFENKISEFVNMHISENITSRDVARYLNISENTLCRQFKKSTGNNLTDYIQQLKVSYAQYYLKSSSMNISQISAMLGFCDSSYFGKVFRKKTGMVPGEYRKKSRR